MIEPLQEGTALGDCQQPQPTSPLLCGYPEKMQWSNNLPDCSVNILSRTNPLVHREPKDVHELEDPDLAWLKPSLSSAQRQNFTDATTTSVLPATECNLSVEQCYLFDCLNGQRSPLQPLTEYLEPLPSWDRRDLSRSASNTSLNRPKNTDSIVGNSITALENSSTSLSRRSSFSGLLAAWSSVGGATERKRARDREAQRSYRT